MSCRNKKIELQFGILADPPPTRGHPSQSLRAKRHADGDEGDEVG